MLEIWEEEAWKYHQWGICQVVTVPESVSSSRTYHSLRWFRHGSSQQNVCKLASCLTFCLCSIAPVFLCMVLEMFSSSVFISITEGNSRGRIWGGAIVRKLPEQVPWWSFDWQRIFWVFAASGWNFQMGETWYHCCIDKKIIMVCHRPKHAILSWEAIVVSNGKRK